MKKEVSNQWTDLMAAVAFAEAGEFDVACEILKEALEQGEESQVPQEMITIKR